MSSSVCRLAARWRGVAWTVTLTSLVFMTGAGQSPEPDAPPESPADLASRQLAWEIDARRSVEVRTVMDIIPSKPNPQQRQVYDALEDHYFETAAGLRRCDSRYLKSGAAVSRYAYYSDGSKAADVSYSEQDLERETTAVIKRQYRTEDRSERMERPEPLRFLYVGREPLHKALPKATCLGEDQNLNRQCDVFLFTKVSWEVPQDQIFHLDRATSIPLKVEAFKDEADRNAKKPLWVWTAQSLDKVDGHFVPLSSEMIAYSEDSQPAFKWRFRVQSIAFDKVFPTAMFWPTLQPGVTVLDAIAGKTRQVPGVKPAQPAKPATTQTMEALPPSGWTTRISSVTLTLGTATLIGAGIYWWRRR
jgi:hypothetical protein